MVELIELGVELVDLGGGHDQGLLQFCQVFLILLNLPVRQIERVLVL